MKLKVKKAFSWAHEHVRIEEFLVGQVIETEDADLIRVASEEEGWATKVKEGKPDAAKTETPALQPDATETKTKTETPALQPDATETKTETETPALQPELASQSDPLAAL